MTTAGESKKSQAASFRTKLLIAMMLVVAGLTGAGLYLAEHNAIQDVEGDLRRDFQAKLLALHSVEEVRNAALTERCRVLVEKPRIHAALEDNAVDLLYPSARDELREVMKADPRLRGEEQASALSARFYRFLDRTGAVLPPPNGTDAGGLHPQEEAQLALKSLPTELETGYLPRIGAREEALIDEIIAVPIRSTETNDVIATLVMGFNSIELERRRTSDGMKSGIWVDKWLRMPGLSESARAAIGREMTHVVGARPSIEQSYPVEIERVPHLLFFKQLNPHSVFPAAYEVCIYPLNDFLARRRHLRWQILGIGAALLVAGFAASHLIATRLAAPVAKLAVDSEQDRADRKRVEASLAVTNEELQRSSRFSADASHQLKTPVTVLRAGLDHLLTRENFPKDVYDELSALVHQTYRLTGLIDDLLLLSRMDAGRLRIEFNPVNLTQLIDEWLDDLSALPDAFDVEVRKDLPPALHIAGEKRYTSLIVQNLLENARKYNQPGGRIQVRTEVDEASVVLVVGNTGPAIPPEMQEYVFERFARGSEGVKISGHGLGLNLARDLARLHGGDLRLVCSNKKWTQFEVRFRLAHASVLSPRPSPARFPRRPSHPAAALPEEKVTGVLPLPHRLCSK